MFGFPFPSRELDMADNDRRPSSSDTDEHQDDAKQLQKICDGLEGIMIPAAIRRRLSDDQYQQLEQLMFAKAARCGLSLSEDTEHRWGDQREED